MKVHMVTGYYFIVNENSFDLYYKDPEKKNPTLLGYFSSIEQIIKKTIQHNLSKNNLESDMMGFLEKWKRMETILVEVLKDYIS